jgi:hypothetical protein
MSGGQTQTKERPDRRGAKKTEAPVWHGIPPDTPLYAAVPRAAPLYDDAHSSIQSRIVDWMMNRKRSECDEKNAWTCRASKLNQDGSIREAPTYEAMARDLRVSKSTIWRAFKLPDTGLFAKKSVQAYEVYSRNGSKRRVRTIYHIPPFAEVLEARRQIPGVVLTKDRHIIVIGRRAEFVKAEMAERWSIKPELVPARKPKPQRVNEYFARAATQAAPKPATSMPAKNLLDEAAVLEALNECEAHADIGDAVDVLADAHNFYAAMPITGIVDVIKAIAERKRLLDKKKHYGGASILSVGWIRNRLQAAIHVYRAQAMKAEAEAARQARWDRDERINRLAGYIVEMERASRNQGRAAPSDDTDRQILEMCEKALAEADPADIDTARALLDAERARKA